MNQNRAQKNETTEPLHIEMGDGEVVEIQGDGLAEPDKSLIAERALELAAVEGRSGSPERLDYENAARELSSNAALLERGDKDVRDLQAERNHPSEAKGAAQTLNRNESQDKGDA
ncbi:hypothetical protein [Pelagicoccus sp. SDUM812003]|uniref:hypothetical protein n=1 Tax=Pelagicoccus sp. SDUM812003 TaxID=3041267 RepID=UPI00280DA42B|nr:hypothetical protein [Pelagicoccus sp. SDUM812003]MDQ8204012.1 hypothetical protein [Pelagicoccus sp. SDUM812003]